MSTTALIALAVCLIATFNDRVTGKYIIGAIVLTALFVEADFVQENVVELGAVQLACGMLWIWRWGSQPIPKSDEIE